MLLVAFKMHGFKQHKTDFPYIFFEEIFQELTSGSVTLLSFCSHIIVRVQATGGPHNQFIVRVQATGGLTTNLL